MNQAAALVRRVEDAGGCVLVDGDRVRVKAPEPLPDALMIEMRAAKAEIVRLFQSQWVDRYEERAGILEFDAGLTRTEAEARAWEFMMVEWQNENPPKNLGPNACSQCGQGGEVLLPLVAGCWVHDRCHSALMAERRRLAAMALMEAGIPPKRRDQ